MNASNVKQVTTSLVFDMQPRSSILQFCSTKYDLLRLLCSMLFIFSLP